MQALVNLLVNSADAVERGCLSDDVLATPHLAGVTDASYGGIARAVAGNVRRLLAGEPLRNCVNAEALRAQR